MPNLAADVQTSLKALLTQPLKLATAGLFSALGYESQKTVRLDGTPSAFLKLVDPANSLANKPDAQAELIDLPQWAGGCEGSEVFQ